MVMKTWKARAMATRMTITVSAPRDLTAWRISLEKKALVGLMVVGLGILGGSGMRKIIRPEEITRVVEAITPVWKEVMTVPPRRGPIMKERPTAMPSLPTMPAA